MENIEEVYKQHSRSVYKYLLCLTKGNEDLAEEITSETFAVAVEKINEFKGNCKISVWLCQIAKFLWYKEIRKNKKIQIEELENIEDIKNVEDVENSIIEKEEKLQIFKSIQKLDEKTKDVMYLRLIGNLNFIEIGEVLGKTANWARVTYYRGKEKIKENERKNI